MSRKSAAVILGLVMLLSALLAAPAFAQTADVKNETVSYIQGLGLPSSQTEKVLSLTRDFLVRLQESSTDLLGVLGEPQKSDPQEQEKQHARFAAIQKEFQVAFEKYKLDVADVVGNEKAAPIIEKVSAMVPAVLLEAPAADNSHATHVAQATQPGSMQMQMPDPGAASSPAEAPIGASSDPALSGSPNLDLQVSGKPNSSGSMGEMGGMGMDQMMGGSMDSMMSMMGGMGGSSSMSGQAMSGLDPAISQGLARLMGNNGQLLQSLAVIQAGAQGSYLQSALQPARQILTQQSALIQNIFGSLNGAAQMPSTGSMPGMSTPGSMGSSSGMMQDSSGMSGMMDMMGTSGMSGSSGSMASGSDTTAAMMLTQLHANYMAIAQMLAIAKTRDDLAPVYQMLSMQGSMIQMLFTHLSNLGSGSSNGSMGSMSHM